MRLRHSRSELRWPFSTLLLVLCCTAACGREDPEARLVRLDIEKPDRGILVDYYLSGYLGADGGDPTAAGLLVRRRDEIYLNLDTLERRYPRSEMLIGGTGLIGRMDWNEFSDFVSATYYDSRAVPPSVEDLRRLHPYGAAEGGWFSVEVNGAMTAASRRIFIREEAIREALRNYVRNGSRVIYPVGTAIVAEHRMDDTVREITAMFKRSDGRWDFATYDGDGLLASETMTPPRSLATPTQCVGCHFGSRLFQPERAFPRQPREGRQGVRAIHVGDELRDAEVVDYFQEHQRRSDTVLGLYATLFVSKLRAERLRGRITAADAELLDQLKL